jgi:iron complex outermembrane receptor protein
MIEYRFKGEKNMRSFRPFNIPTFMLVAAVANLMYSSAGYAQAVTAASTENSTSPGTTGALEEIVVTARKRAERLQDVPDAIEAITAKDIQTYSLQTLQDVSNLTPGLVIGGNQGQLGGTITLRGIGAAAASNVGVEQPVSINVDGVQISQGNILRLGLLDLGQLEVLEGPQALFYGKNSPGGIISITSADPGDHFEAKIRTGYEIYNEQKFIEGTVSGPISDTLRARLDVYGSNQLGWFENNAVPSAYSIPPSIRTAPDDSESAERLTLIWDPTDKFDVKLKLSHGQLNDHSGPQAVVQTFSCAGPTPQATFGLPSGALCGLGRYYTKGDIPAAQAALAPQAYDGTKPYLASNQNLLAMTATYKVDPRLTITSVTGYYHIREGLADEFAGNELADLTSANLLDLNQYTEELRAATSFDIPINFVVGGFYEYQYLSNLNPVTLGPPIVPTATLDANPFAIQRTNAYSLFGQAIYNIVPQWQLTAGARYSHEEKSERNFQVGAPTGGASSGPLTQVLSTEPVVAFDNVSPEVTLTYKIDPDFNVYGAYRQGFASGGFNLSSFAAGTNNSFKQETARGGELGAKGRLLDGRLEFTSDIFHYTYENLQLSTFNPDTVAISIQNAGSSFTKGVEGAVKYAPEALPGTTLHGGVAYTDARYTRFLAACYGGQSIAQGCDLNPVGTAFQSQNLAGYPLVNAPDWSGDIGTAYDYRVADNIQLSTTVDGTFRSSYYFGPDGTRAEVQPGYWKLDASIALRGADGGWEVALIGKNLTNKLDATSGYIATFSGSGTGTAAARPGDIGAIVDLPRTLLIQVTLTTALLHR